MSAMNNTDITTTPAAESDVIAVLRGSIEVREVDPEDQIEELLAAGDLGGAVEYWDSLPEDERFRLTSPPGAAATARAEASSAPQCAIGSGRGSVMCPPTAARTRP